jgi:hypothetical protein
VTVEKLIKEAQERAAAKKDPTLHAHEAPAGYRLRGVSTLLDAAGETVLTWVKTAKEQDEAAALLDAFELAVAERKLPATPRVVAPRGAEKELLTVYPMGDPHLGMLAWAGDTGADFDIKIAEANLTSAVDRLVSLAPASETALVINLGDFFHADSADARTSSGNKLDVDSRWSKVLRIGVHTQVRCIDRALEKHKTVRVINEIGNHDPHSSIMLSVCLSHHYRLNPRVQIDTSPSPFHWLEFGKVLIGVTHGHSVKAERLPGIMAHDQAEAWGRTQHRYWYCGHVHHQSVKEYPGVVIETFRTLASRDAWHHGAGYRAGRSMVCDVMSRTRGRIMRHEVGVESL